MMFLLPASQVAMLKRRRVSAREPLPGPRRAVRGEESSPKRDTTASNAPLGELEVPTVHDFVPCVGQAEGRGLAGSDRGHRVGRFDAEHPNAWIHDERTVRLRIADDGQPGLSARPDGHGLVGMRERAAALGGELSAGPGTPTGWTVEATIPAPGVS
jgi:hypothetical protein